MAKLDVCGFHCPNWAKWLFVLITLWFTLSAFGLTVYGTFWSWMVLLTGLCAFVCNVNMKGKSKCLCCKIPALCSLVFGLVGLWFVLGAEGILPTFGLNLLYLSAFLIGASLVVAQK